MKEESQGLENSLKEKFGEALNFSYVDVQGEEMKEYPKIAAILKQVRLPLTVLNGEPRFHGGLSLGRVEKAVNELLAGKG